MKTSTHLAIALGSLGGLLLLVGVFVFLRFKFRASRRARSAPVSPEYEAKVDEMSADAGGASVVATPWGLTPVAGVGPNRTRSYFNGWFGLDAPTSAGWVRQPDATHTSPSSGNPNGPRESHFSAASRRSRRSRRGRASRSLDADDTGDMLEKGQQRKLDESEKRDIQVEDSASESEEEQEVDTVQVSGSARA